MEFSVAGDSAGTVRVTISGELDMSNIEEVEREVAPVLEHRPQRLIVDVAGLRFADSSAIALWVQWAAAVDHFELHDPPPLLRRVIAGMGLTDRLAVES
jgi:anti-anti-sigma factor